MAAGTDNPPPGHVSARFPQETSNSAGRSGKTSLGGHLSIGHYLTSYEPGDHLQGGVFEFGQSVPKRRSPMSPNPGAM